MASYAQLCQQAGIPLWVAPILAQAAAMKCDAKRRQKAYKLIHRHLLIGGIGLEKTPYPTYVYPQELKDMLRTVFPEGLCNYPDPDHGKVVNVTVGDLHSVEKTAAGEGQGQESLREVTLRNPTQRIQSPEPPATTPPAQKGTRGAASL